MSNTTTSTVPDSFFHTKQHVDTFIYHCTDEHLYFWASPSFANGTIAPFTYKEIIFNCSEQAYMWEKAMHFKDAEQATKILLCSDPRDQQAEARKVKNFTDEEWDKVKVQYMYDVCYAKFSQHTDYADALVATHLKVLVEAVPWDTVWGIGMSTEEILLAYEEHTKWKGQNLLGEVLMKVRAQLRKDRNLPESKPDDQTSSDCVHYDRTSRADTDPSYRYSCSNCAHTFSVCKPCFDLCLNHTTEIPQLTCSRCQQTTNLIKYTEWRCTNQVIIG